MLSPKELKKLVKTCREMGIKHYKGPDFEFTLTDEVPVKSKKGTEVSTLTSATPKNPSEHPKIESDETMTDEALMFWSTGDGGMPLEMSQE